MQHAEAALQHTPLPEFTVCVCILIRGSVLCAPVRCLLLADQIGSSTGYSSMVDLLGTDALGRCGRLVMTKSNTRVARPLCVSFLDGAALCFLVGQYAVSLGTMNRAVNNEHTRAPQRVHGNVF